jgi:hypothetical protein
MCIDDDDDEAHTGSRQCPVIHRSNPSFPMAYRSSVNGLTVHLAPRTGGALFFLAGA